MLICKFKNEYNLLCFPIFKFGSFGEIAFLRALSSSHTQTSSFLSYCWFLFHLLSWFPLQGIKIAKETSTDPETVAIKEEMEKKESRFQAEVEGKKENFSKEEHQRLLEQYEAEMAALNERLNHQMGKQRRSFLQKQASRKRRMAEKVKMHNTLCSLAGLPGFQVRPAIWLFYWPNIANLALLNVNKLEGDPKVEV